MKAWTSAVIHPGGRLGALTCEPPLTLRRVTADDPAVCSLCLVGTAAGPLPGDELTLELRLEDGAQARLQATGASIAQGHSGVPATYASCVELGAGARLVADPGPLIVCQGSRVDVSLRIALGPGAAIEWRELVILGRSTDASPGAATLRWDVERAGRPVLRQAVDLTAAQAWPGITGGHRVLASTFISDPGLDARTVVLSSTAAAQRIDEHSMLLTVLGNSAAAVARDLDALILRTLELSPQSV